jgi:hypothetical protein
MKKILTLGLLVGGLSLPLTAQQRQSTAGSATSSQTQTTEKMQAIMNCEELYLQLTNKFGKNFSLSDKKVLAQLEANVHNREASRCIRKKSLYALYGEDFVNHLELINDGKTH